MSGVFLAHVFCFTMNYPTRVALVCFCAVAALRGEPTPAKVFHDGLMPAVKTPDSAAVELRTLIAQSVADEASVPDQASPARKNLRVDKFLQAADGARALRAAHPDSAESFEAEVFEAKCLLNIALAADKSQETRAAKLIGEIRGDSRIPARARFEVVALSEVVRLQSVSADREQFLAASELSARNLIGEFPQETGGYEALFRLAENQPDDAKGAGIAREIMRMPAPALIKDQVQVYLDRRALIGQSLPEIADGILGAGNPISASKGKSILLYTWASWNPGSVAFARNLIKLAPKEVALVGVNFDLDAALARNLAQKETLPGAQLYADGGLDSSLARALKVTTAMEAYVADAHGNLREVAAQRGDFTARIKKAIR